MLLLTVAIMLVSRVSGQTDCPDVDSMVVHLLLDVSGSVSIPGGLPALQAFSQAFMEEVAPSPKSPPGRSYQRIFSKFSYSATMLYEDGPGPTPNPVALANAIGGLVIDGRTTNTAAALAHVQAYLQSDVCNAVVIVTDGESDDYAATAAAAQQLHDDGVRICVVPVGRSSCEGEAELDDLAGENGEVVTDAANLKPSPLLAAVAAAECVCRVCTPEVPAPSGDFVIVGIEAK